MSEKQKGEGCFERQTFRIIAAIKILTPPLYSLKRLEAYCQKRIVKNSQAYSPRWLLADMYKNHRKYSEARDEYLVLERLGYLSRKDWISMAEVFFRLGDFEAIVSRYEDVAERYPKEKLFHWYLGCSYISTSKWDLARTHLETSIQMGNVTAEEYWRLGMCYFHLNELEKARLSLLKASSDKQHSREIRKGLALVHIKKGEAELEIVPSQSGKVWSEEYLRRVGLAEEEFERALEYDSDSTQARDSLEYIRKAKAADNEVRHATL